MYAHNDAGLDIVTCKPPWERGKTNEWGKRRMGKNQRKKIKRIKRAVQDGDQQKISRAFRYLRPKDKMKLKIQYGLTNSCKFKNSS